MKKRAEIRYQIYKHQKKAGNTGIFRISFVSGTGCLTYSSEVFSFLEDNVSFLLHTEPGSRLTGSIRPSLQFPSVFPLPAKLPDTLIPFFLSCRVFRRRYSRFRPDIARFFLFIFCDCKCLYYPRIGQPVTSCFRLVER